MIEAVRWCWFIAQALCIPFASRGTSPLWFAYLLASASLSFVYYPEDRGWAQRFSVWIAAVLLLRIGAVLESLHRQTRGFRYWTRLTAGAWLIAAALTAGIWAVAPPTGQHAVAVELRRYVQIWIFLVVVVTHGMLERMGIGRLDRHALILGGIAANHALVSAASILRKYDLATWQTVGMWSMLVDTALYVAWTTGGLWASKANSVHQGRNSIFSTR